MSRVMVVEDDVGIRRVVTLWLTRHGHEVCEARNGREALESFAAFRPDVLITDVNMPEMDGLALIERIGAAETRPTGIIVLTNRWDHREIGEKLSGTGAQVFPKPFSPSKLAEQVALMLRPQPAQAGDEGGSDA